MSATGFDGRWELDPEGCRVWNAATGAYEPDAVGREVITIRHVDGRQDYEVEYGDDPLIRMGYRAAYDDTAFVPYLVREIVAAPGVDEAASVAEFRRRIRADQGTLERRFEVGRPYGMVRLISGDPRTHYRLSRDPEGDDILHIMLRRLAPDGDSYLSSVFDRDGIVNRIRRFVRADPR